MQTDQTVHKRTAVPSSSIQTILSVLELHQILRNALADFTANREFHPAPKTLLFSCFPCNYNINYFWKQ
mgnify:CR=1 FL=1